MRNWYLAPREQRWLMVGTCFIVLFIGHSLLWAPQAKKRLRLQTAVDEQHQVLDWMAQTQKDIEKLRQKPVTTADHGTSLFSLVEQGALNANLAEHIQQIEPQGQNKVRLQLQAAPFQKAMVWLQLMQQKKIGIERISIDKTEQPGTVDLRVTLLRAAS